MIDFLKHIDTSIFIFLNSLHSPFFDTIMWYITNGLTWIPVFLIFLYALIKKYKYNTIWIILFISLLITFTDRASVVLFKNIFMRYRPCHNLDLQAVVHIVNGKCGGQYGFVSSHASNYFGIASFLIIILNIRNLKLLLPIIFWVLIIVYSRIYLGVHYPSDIVAGAILGSAIGLTWAKICLYFLRKMYKHNNQLLNTN